MVLVDLKYIPSERKASHLKFYIPNSPIVLFLSTNEKKLKARVLIFLVDSEDGANNYEDFCIHPDAQYKNKAAQWTSSITPDHPMFKVCLFFSCFLMFVFLTIQFLQIRYY